MGGGCIGCLFQGEYVREWHVDVYFNVTISYHVIIVDVSIKIDICIPSIVIFYLTFFRDPYGYHSNGGALMNWLILVLPCFDHVLELRSKHNWYNSCQTGFFKQNQILVVNIINCFDLSLMSLSPSFSRILHWKNCLLMMT